jgi:hypothetical protein
VLKATKLKPFTDDELDVMADALVESGNYRIQRPIRPRPKIDAPAGIVHKEALVDARTRY